MSARRGERLDVSLPTREEGEKWERMRLTGDRLILTTRGREEMREKIRQEKKQMREAWGFYLQMAVTIGSSIVDEYRNIQLTDLFVERPELLGAQIRVSTPFESTSGNDDTQIIDMTPATTSGGPNPGFDDATLLATAPPYVDGSAGVVVSGAPTEDCGAGCYETDASPAPNVPVRVNV